MITLQIMSHDYQQWRWTDNDIPEGDWWRHGHIFDDACTRQLQSLSFCSCQTYTVSLCQPNGWQWDHAVFCLAFLLGFLHSVAQTFFFFWSRSSYTHENWVSTTESFTSVMQLHYVNIFFHPPICPTQWQVFKVCPRAEFQCLSFGKVSVADAAY